MLPKLLFLLWVLSFGLYDRIDLFGGTQNVKFLINYVISSIFALYCLITSLFRPLISSAVVFQWRYFLFGVFLLLFMVWNSVLFSEDIALSVKRAILVSYIILTSGLIILYIRSSFVFSEILKVLVLGFCIGLCLNYLASVVQLFEYLGYSHISTEYLDLMPRRLSTIMPRLSGFFIDPNHACIYYLISNIFFDLCIREVSQIRTKLILLVFVILNVVFIFLTMSRSGMALAVFYLYVRKYTYEGSNIKLVFQWGLLSLVLGFAGGLIFILSSSISYVADVLLPAMINRMTVDLFGGSGLTHVNLIFQAFFDSTETVKRIIVGSGYGAGHLNLVSIFGQTKDANYHSQYLSFLVETGWFGGILSLILAAYPLNGLLKKDPLQRAFAAAVMIYFFFNLIYQSQVMPLYWFVLFSPMLYAPVIKNPSSSASFHHIAK